MKFDFLKKKKKNSAEEANEVQDRRRKEALNVTKNWYADRYQSAVVQRNLLALISLISLGGVLVCAFAVQQISSSKTIEPFVIEVQETSGIATVVDQLSIKQFVAEETIVRYFLVKYTRAREGYDYTSFRHNYDRVVRLYSTSEIYRAFKRGLGSDPDNVINKLSTHTKRTVKIKSIQFLDDSTAQIRFLLTDIKKGGVNMAAYHKIAIIGFKFLPNLKMSIEDRYVNPLNFQVTSYTVDDETILQ